MKKHNLEAVAKAAGIVLVGRGKGKSKVVVPEYNAILKFCKIITARCTCCNRLIPVSASEGNDKGHVCRKGNCQCR
jgi:hypothetical protein